MTDLSVEKTIEKLTGEVGEFIKSSNEEAQSQAKLGLKHTEQMKSLEDRATELFDRMSEVEQKQASSAGDESEKSSTAGQEFIKSEAFEALQKGASSKVRYEAKSTLGGSDVFVQPQDLAGLIENSTRTLSVASALQSGTTTSNAVHYIKENVFTNNAAEVAEKAAKPETDITFSEETASVATIAHWIKMSKQMVDDAPMMASFVDGRMRYGVEYRKDTQLINGNGTGANISGILNTGNHTVFVPNQADFFVSIRQAITLCSLAEYPATAVMMNPSDVQVLDLTKASDGMYIAANPRTNNAATVWGLPIIQTQTIAAGTFICGAFSVANQVWNRQGTVIDISESDGDNFTANLLTLRAEQRCTLATYRPASIQAGLLSNA